MSRWKSFPRLLPGDWLVLGGGLLAVLLLFATLWHPQHASRLQIRDRDGIFATFSLAQDRTVEVAGPLGITRIRIEHGQARFVSSPCHNQYCVHQGWLSHAGQAAVCLPNRISLELLGSAKRYDSLNY